MPETATTIIEKNPTKQAPDGVYVYHDTKSKVSLGVQLDNGVVYGALAICNPKDQFNRKDARKVIHRRLETRCPGRWSVFRLSRYAGDEFKNEVFMPLLKRVRSEAGLLIQSGRQDGNLKDRLLMLRGILQETV